MSQDGKKINPGKGSRKQEQETKKSTIEKRNSEILQEPETKTEDVSPSSSKVFMGCDEFIFRNNDIYRGGFRATVEGGIFRQGNGEYVTSEGQIYQGVWENDEIQDELLIQHPDGSYYEGGDFKLLYSGEGSYVFPDKATLTCTFKYNKPTGLLQLVHPQGGEYLGEAEEHQAFLLRKNRFIPPDDEIIWK